MSWKTTLMPHVLVVTLALGCGASAQSANAQREGDALKMELAALYINKGAHAAAIPLLQRIIGENPRNVEARVMYGVVLRDTGLYPQARRELEHCLRLAPARAEIHGALGVLYDVWQRPKEALPHHVSAVKLAPASASFRNNLGFSLYLSGDTDAAVKQLETALAMDPSLTVAYNNLAFAYGRRGNFVDAERTFRAMLGEAATLMNMAMIYEEHGRTDEAAAVRAKALALEPALQHPQKESRP
jgi:pentatricopeptide repeat protein